ncbi:MAG TPA: hypothetical protein VHZ99_10200 [Steroidobacteraceae bacterium]|nr:hypothetical protein [Steroidobacteraceae bacterium]
MFRRFALTGLLVGGCASIIAGEPGGAVPSAHGPMLMLYISRPIGGRGSTPIYGLRLDQSSGLAGNEFAPLAMQSTSRRRPLIDVQLSNVQLQRPADLRVEFGRRLTWDVRRREFSLPSTLQSRTFTFVARNP